MDTVRVKNFESPFDCLSNETGLVQISAEFRVPQPFEWRRFRDFTRLPGQLNVSSFAYSRRLMIDFRFCTVCLQWPGGSVVSLLVS